MKNEDKINHINNEINININNELNQNKEKITEEELKKLLQIIINNNKFNDEKTKINMQEDYDFLILIINKLNNEEFISFLKFLNKIKISILKILINGFIDYDFKNENQENIILKIIAKVINIEFNKDIFYFVYGKLSFFYRRHDNINSLNSIIRFDKLFKIWKLLYNIEIYFENYESNTVIPTIALFPEINKDKKNVSFNIGKNIKIGKFNKGIDKYNITINFFSCIVLNLNKYIDNFSFLKLYNDSNSEVEVKYEDIFSDKNDNIDNINELFKVKTLKFQLLGESIIIFINDMQIKKQKKKFNFNSIKKIEILNNFMGEISSISIEKYFISVDNPKEIVKENLILAISTKNYKTQLTVYLNEKKLEHNIIQNYILYNGELFSNKMSNKILTKNKLELCDIKYFGGFDCFLPLFKIINYIIKKIENIINNNIDNENKENKNDIIYNYMNEPIIIWIKDIIKIMIKMICLSENNYKDFKKIIVSLIGSLAEILHTLKSLSNNYVTLLFKDEIFFVLYIIILNSTISNNIKRIYKNLFKIDDYFKNDNYKFESIYFNIKKNRIKNLDWYFLFLFNFIEFMMLYFETTENIPKKLIKQLTIIYLYKKEELKNISNNSVIISLIPFIDFMEEYCFGEKKNINEIFKTYHNLLKDSKFYLNYVISMIKTFLNADNASKKVGFNLNLNIFLNIQQLIVVYIFDEFKGISNTINKSGNIIDLIISQFKDYIYNINFIQKVFPILYEEDFTPENKLIMEELIDYHGQYHHIIKELFIFNRLWSDQTLFFKNTLKGIKESKLKYKNINYYTKNFQRPILYPYLDYKYHYPNFSQFNINKDFYKIEEIKDDYNYEIECPELDELIQEYDEDILKNIEEKGKINIFENICLVKQAYHIKGNIFVVNDIINRKITIYFYSHPYYFQNNIEKKAACNKKTNKGNNININNKNNLCYGAIFQCPKKEGNRKILIELEDVRLMMKRIYYYRQSAIEIFTETKSYYFNFLDEKKRDDFFSLFVIPYDNLYFPININGNIIGIKKVNRKLFEKLDYLNIFETTNGFIEFISDKISNKNLCEMCIFDLIILINLISNRSYNDLNQFPIFPLLYFFNRQKNEIVNRDLKNHIGFQKELPCSKIRCNLFIEDYKEKKRDYEEDNGEEIPYYFNTHYSNIVYTCNYLIRLFPFSFIAIELQGNGFDDPNRLFYSIEDTFYNMASQKSDLRELIPEFFYLPEMFMNINYINFHERNNSILVDDVIMLKKDFIKQDKNKEINNIEKYFLFVAKMKSKLEKSKDNIYLWLNNIFGIYHKYNKEKEQLFRTESYIDFDQNNYDHYLNNEIIMSSVEFGIIPLQILFDKKVLKKTKSNYEKINSDIKNEFNLSTIRKSTKRKTKEKKKEDEKTIIYKDNKIKENKNYIKKYSMSDNYFNNNKYKDYWEEYLDINFQICNENNIGKVIIYKNNNIDAEIIDHNNEIIDLFYNRRLNMFSTISYDGFICSYILPNKLISMIKCPNNSYYDQILLSANPFPSIIAINKKENSLTSYSINGIMIKTLIIENNNLEMKVEPIFNIYGGTFKDRINIHSKGYFKIFNVPFFEESKE